MAITKPTPLSHKIAEHDPQVYAVSGVRILPQTREVSDQNPPPLLANLQPVTALERFYELSRLGRHLPGTLALEALLEVCRGQVPPDGRLGSLIGIAAKSQLSLPWQVIADALGRWRKETKFAADVGVMLMDAAFSGGIEPDALRSLMPATVHSPRAAAPIKQITGLDGLSWASRAEHIDKLWQKPVEKSPSICGLECAEYICERIYRHMKLDANPDLPLLETLFSGNLETVGQVAGILNQIETPLPGYAFLLARNAREHFFFMANAIPNSAQSLASGVGAMPIIALPKTASSMIVTGLSKLLGIDVGTISIDHLLPISPWIAFAARYPIALHDHVPPTRAMLRYLSKANIPQVQFHVRDPRQIAVSLTHHAIKYGSAGGGNFANTIDLVIDQLIYDYSDWLETWIEEMAALGVRSSITRYEDFALDPKRFFVETLKFHNITHLSEELISHTVDDLNNKQRGIGGDNICNFRKGELNEWQKILSRTQIKRIEGAVHGKLADMYL